jgi:hypothetical protein
MGVEKPPFAFCRIFRFLKFLPIYKTNPPTTGTVFRCFLDPLSAGYENNHITSIFLKESIMPSLKGTRTENLKAAAVMEAMAVAEKRHSKRYLYLHEGTGAPEFCPACGFLRGCLELLGKNW